MRTVDVELIRTRSGERPAVGRRRRAALREIAGLTAAGLPLAPGLRATAEEMPRGRLRSALESVADALDRGASVDEALAAQGAGLPAHLRGLIAVGTRTGKVSHVLGRFVAFNNVGADLRRQLLISLAYPLLSLAIAAGDLHVHLHGAGPELRGDLQGLRDPAPGPHHRHARGLARLRVELAAGPSSC